MESKNDVKSECKIHRSYDYSNGLLADLDSDNEIEEDEEIHEIPSFSTVLDRSCISDGEDVSIPKKKIRCRRKDFHRSLSLSDMKYLRTSRIFAKKRFTRSSSDSDCLTTDEDDDEERNPQKSAEKSSCCNCGGGLRKYDRQQKLTLICLVLINFGAYLSMSIIAPFFPIEAEQKGMSISTIGYVFSSYALVMFCFSPVIGQFITLVGVKFTFISGVFLAAGSNILFGALDFIVDSGVFTAYCFLLRSTEALGAAAFVTASCTIVAEIFPDDVGAVFGIVETFVGLGMTVGPAVGSGLYFLGGYELPFYTLGSILMITVPICMVVLPDPQPKELLDKTSPVSILKLVCLPTIIIISLVVMVLCGIWGFLDPTLEPHLRENIGTPLMVIGLVLTSFCLLFMGPDVILPFLPRTLSLNVTALAVMGISIGMGLIPTYQAMLKAAYDGGYEENTLTFGLVSSIFSSASSLGEFIGPALGGFLFEKYSYDYACTCIGIFAFCIAGVLVLYKIFYTGLVRKGKEIAPVSRISTKSKISDSGIYEISIPECSTETTLLLGKQKQRSIP